MSTFYIQFYFPSFDPCEFRETVRFIKQLNYIFKKNKIAN